MDVHDKEVLELKISYMREYIALAINLNFTETANMLYIAQPVLSRHIAAIEKEIGSLLMDRTKHHVSLTPVGKLTLEEFQIIVERYDALTSKISLLTAGVAGIIRIGMPSYAIEEYFTPLGNYYKNNYPDIKLHFSSCQTHQIIDNLIKDKLDIGLFFHHDAVNTNQISFHPIGREKIVLMVSDKHPFASRSSIGLSEVLHQPIIFSQSVNDFQEYIKSTLLERGFTLPKITTIDYGQQIDLLPFLIREENGIAFVPNYMRSTQRNNIVFVDIEEIDFSVDVVLAYKAGNTNPALLFFLQHIGQIFPNVTKQ